MARKRRSKAMPEPAPTDEPPMAPFIDVTFQLLIFFMLTLKFKTVEGNLLSILPKDKGLAATTVQNPELNEIRVNMCCHTGRRFDQHMGYKEAHQDHLKDQRKRGEKVGDVTWVWLDQAALRGGEVLELYKTEKFPSKAQHNRDVLNKIADDVMARRPQVKSKRDPSKSAPTIIDVDGLVPYEHALMIFAFLQKRGIDNIEWAGNPRFDRYYGPDNR